MHRRTATHAVLTSLAGLASVGLHACARPVGASGAYTTPLASADFARRVRDIEAGTGGGRLGVAFLDTQTGALHGHRADERFPMCSTFKLVVAAAVLHRVDSAQESLDRRVPFGPTDRVDYAPITNRHLAEGAMTVAALCDAMLTYSDNTAANLLLQSLGGPPALIAYFRSLGDEVSRLDRVEPDLNSAIPGDPRDTTTPHAMLQTMQNIVLGDALAPASRAQMIRWLLANTTGERKLKALLPTDWRVADKTGAGANGSNNDVAVIWPSTGAPVLVCAYLTGSQADAAMRDRALAQVGALAAVALRAGR